MANTKEIRKQNTSHIKQVLGGGQEYTVRMMSEKTGLSIATCNTILQELVRENIALAEERQLNEVGRKNCIYRINAVYESILYLRCLKDGHGRPVLNVLINYLYGGHRAADEHICESFSFEEILSFLRKKLDEYRGVTLVMLSFPHPTEADFSERLQRALKIPVYAARDVDYLAYNYFRERTGKGKSVSFLRLSGDSVAEAFNAFDGKVTGNSVCRLHCLPENGGGDITNILLSVIAVFAPDEIVFLGGDEEKGRVRELYEKCAQNIETSDMPRFICYPSTEKTHLFGMFYLSMELKNIKD